jgi:hypothetical protein
MSDQYDIFRVESDGAPVWVEPSPNIDYAETRAQQLGISRPGDYFALCQKTGNRIPLRPRRS